MKYEGLQHNEGYQKSFPGDFTATHFSHTVLYAKIWLRYTVSTSRSNLCS